MRVSACKCVQVRVSACKCVYVRVGACVQTCVCACMRMYLLTARPCVYVCFYENACSSACASVHVFVNILTHNTRNTLNEP